MSEELTKLKSLGPQKIYEDTHIPVQHVKAILEHNFDSLNRVQFLGFVSILEREYSLDLSILKASGIAYYDDKDAQKLDENIFIAPQKTNKSSTFYAIVAIIIFIIVMTYKMGFSGEEEQQEQEVNNTLIQKVQKTIKPVVVEELVVVEEINSTSESNESNEINEAQTIAEETPQVVKSFKIVTKSKVWFGYIDVDTNKKRQKTFKGEIDLDPQKRWLLIFGHAYIDMYINGEQIKMNSRDKIRFLYEDGSVKAISTQEFRKLNRGRKW
ncbi:hypothetical protein JHD47_04335 [Sulfurimonas sp. SAG-AH-194-L11]|nr:hypothetical protein [Sulfurimonas sp. SAG-AH-194-L11]MDF1877035.1 hypothetical protein [Sulfurimonas sp. SAG-AH-194-L11]